MTMTSVFSKLSGSSGSTLKRTSPKRKGSPAKLPCHDSTMMTPSPGPLDCGFQLGGLGGQPCLAALLLRTKPANEARNLATFPTRFLRVPTLVRPPKARRSEMAQAPERLPSVAARSLASGFLHMARSSSKDRARGKSILLSRLRLVLLTDRYQCTRS
jgi:hypothetical protein